MMMDNVEFIDSIDINIEQNYLCQLKLAVCKYYRDIDKILKYYQGTEDNIIDELDLTNECKKFWKNNNDKIRFGINRYGKFEQLFRDFVSNKFDYECFSIDNLEKIFGKDAVKNTFEYKLHFETIMKIYKEKYLSENNYFYYQILNDSYNKNSLPPYLNMLEKLIDSKTKINYCTNSFYEFIENINEEKYTLVNISNILDWIDVNLFEKIINKIYDILFEGGILIIRKLNGNYDLKNYVKKFKIIDSVPIDQSYFYKQVIVCMKEKMKK